MLTLAFLRSSVGRKYLVGVSGLMLVGFAVIHLLGNLTIFIGQDAMNAYAEKLVHLGPLLWVARIMLIAAAAVHAVTAIQLARENRAARPVGYRKEQSFQTTFAAKTMAVSGIFLLAYIVYHLLHFTFGVTQPAIAHLKDPLNRHDVHSMVILGFQDIKVVAIYVVAMALLCSHLSHGIASMFQSVGINDDRYTPLLKRISHLTAAFLFIGYSSIPLAIYFGLVKLAGGMQ